MNLFELHIDILYEIFYYHFDLFELYVLKQISKKFCGKIKQLIKNKLAIMEKNQLEFYNRIIKNKDNIISTSTCSYDSTDKTFIEKYFPGTQSNAIQIKGQITQRIGKYSIFFHEESISIYDMNTGNIIFQIGGKFSKAIFNYPYLIVQYDDIYTKTDSYRKRKTICSGIYIHNVMNGHHKCLNENHIFTISFSVHNNVLFNININTIISYSLTSCMKIGEFTLSRYDIISKIYVSDEYMMIRYPMHILIPDIVDVIAIT